jgi:hypothetical protein
MATTRFYKYFFRGLENPVIMEAESKLMADDMLYHLSQKSKTNINMSLLEDVRVETPLFGISKRKRHGKDFVWVGKDKTSDGWLEQKEYDAIQKLKKTTKND